MLTPPHVSRWHISTTVQAAVTAADMCSNIVNGVVVSIIDEIIDQTRVGTGRAAQVWADRDVNSAVPDGHCVALGDNHHIVGSRLSTYQTNGKEAALSKRQQRGVLSVQILALPAMGH